MVSLVKCGRWEIGGHKLWEVGDWGSGIVGGGRLGVRNCVRLGIQICGRWEIGGQELWEVGDWGSGIVGDWGFKYVGGGRLASCVTLYRYLKHIRYYNAHYKQCFTIKLLTIGIELPEMYCKGSSHNSAIKYVPGKINYLFICDICCIVYSWRQIVMLGRLSSYSQT